MAKVKGAVVKRLKEICSERGIKLNELDNISFKKVVLIETFIFYSPLGAASRCCDLLTK